MDLEENRINRNVMECPGRSGNGVGGPEWN